MGGCCCSSRKPQLHGTPIYYYCPPSLEEQDSLASDDSTGFLFDLNLDRSTPDTYRPPPAPIPYGVVIGNPRKQDSDSIGEIVSGCNFESLSDHLDLKGLNCKTQTGLLLGSPRNFEELLQSNIPNMSATEEEDVCPICLEEYDEQNPELNTKCNHHFHLSCILEWMERNDTCPICDQEMSV